MVSNYVKELRNVLIEETYMVHFTENIRHWNWTRNNEVMQLAIWLL